MPSSKSTILLKSLLPTVLLILASCSTLEVTSPDSESSTSTLDGLSLDVNILFAPENPEPATTIRFMVPEPGWVRLEALNITGYRVRLLVDEYVENSLSVVWDAKNDDGEDVKSGIYVYRLQWKQEVHTKLTLFCRTREECEKLLGND